MSVPDALGYLRLKMNVFTRESEYERPPSFYAQAQGVWLDEFQGHWINELTIESHLSAGKKICIVSPELHKREHQAAWQDYKRIELKLGKDAMMLCTDFPEQAQEFFNE